MLTLHREELKFRSENISKVKSIIFSEVKSIMLSDKIIKKNYEFLSRGTKYFHEEKNLVVESKALIK